jgi:hypothetical protein
MLLPTVWAQPEDKHQFPAALGHRAIVMIVADKMDSVEFYGSRLPGIRQLIKEGACGLMTIRSGSGYTNTNSAYLTLGSGNRSVAPGVLNGAYAKKTHTWRDDCR